MVTDAGQLPDRLRLRVVSLVAAVLPSVAPLPPPLRKIAGFAPARRARLGATAIWHELQDDAFRGHAAVQVATVDPVDGDPVDAGARAWLTRGEGWEVVVSSVAEQLPAGPDEPDADGQEIVRLTAQVAALQAELAATRADHDDRIEQARADHAVLRRRLGEARAALRQAEAGRDEAVAARADALAEVDRVVRVAQEDARRLRSEIAEAAAGSASARRGERSARDSASIRARYLLETVIEASTGLRRELGLPVVDGTPGDEVQAGLASSAPVRTTSAPATPAVLDQLVSMPRSRLVVDGYNVTKGAWPSASLEAQRSRLLSALAPIVARTGVETTVVFDAGSVAARAAVPTPRGVRVVFSPEGVIADDVVRQLVDAEPRGRVVIVVTDDRELGADVVRAGARLVPAAVLVELVTR